ncbi:MAG TPA: TIGR00303 family protein [Halobacteriales archaeon]|nr:TIGR00303 family protein [Halobacteriales archaeon]
MTEPTAKPPTFVLVAGNTETASIEGISAAGASPELARHTPAADAEVLTYGRPVRAPALPVSPSGCPTPALITRAVRELVGFEASVVDAGLAEPTAVRTVDVGGAPGGDVRDVEPVPDAGSIVEDAHKVGGSLPDGEVLVAETIPGGTTTALGVLRALGEPYGVSSSLRANPVERKRAVVRDGLAASSLGEGDLSGDPVAALRLMGDPVLAAVVGLVRGALEAGATVTLAGGTQMVAAAALLRHAGVDSPLSLATTSFVAADPSVDLAAAARGLDLDVTATDPGFDGSDHPAMAAYARGEAKEGVGMGGALAVADRAGISMADVRDRIEARYADLVDDPPAAHGTGVTDGGP